jgi:hypothetical protein
VAVPVSSVASVTFYPGSLVGSRITGGVVINFTGSGITDPAGSGNLVTSIGTQASPYPIGNLYNSAGLTTLVFNQLTGALAKANWNYELVTQDGSLSVHNPTFVFNVISSTTNALASPGTAY